MTQSLLTSPPTSANLSVSAGRAPSDASSDDEAPIVRQCFAIRIAGQAPPSPHDCPTCTPENTTRKPIREEYLGGVVVLCGYPESNRVMKGWLDTMAALDSGQKLVSALRACRGGPIAIIYQDPDCAEIAYPGNAFVKRLVTKSAWWACTTSQAANLRARATAYNDGHPGEHSAYAGPGLPSRSEQFGGEAPADERWLVPGVGVSRDECFVCWDTTRGIQANDPGAALIGHELIHCLHAIKGEWLTDWADGGKTPGLNGKACTLHNEYEEARTIGVRADHYDGEELSENRIRHDLGAVLIASHCGVIDFEPWAGNVDQPLRRPRGDEIPEYP